LYNFRRFSRLENNIPRPAMVSLHESDAHPQPTTSLHPTALVEISNGIEILPGRHRLAHDDIPSTLGVSLYNTTMAQKSTKRRRHTQSDPPHDPRSFGHPPSVDGGRLISPRLSRCRFWNPTAHDNHVTQFIEPLRLAGRGWIDRPDTFNLSRR